MMVKSRKSYIAILLVIAGLIAGAFNSYAETGGVEQASTGIIPCGTDEDRNGVVTGAEKCSWKDVVILASNFIDLVIMIVSVAAAIAFMYGGFLYITSAGRESSVEKAKAMFKKVLAGYIVILTAWVVVHAIELAFFRDDSDRPPSFLGSDSGTS